MDVHETDFDQLVLPLMSAINGLSKLAAALEDAGGPALGVGGLLVGSIIRQEASTLGLELKVSARRQVIKSLFEKLFVVTDASFQFTAVNVIKGLLIDPVILKVINFEETVGRGPISVIPSNLAGDRLSYQSG